MLRFLISMIFILFTAPVTSAQTTDAVAEARLVYIAGDYATALAVLRPAAEAGNPIAQNIMGAAYEEGNGVAPDTEAALDWYHRAAAQEFDKAIYNIAVFYEKTHPNKAIVYYDRAVALDYPSAMHNRGLMLLNGYGGPVDIEAAAEMLQHAADLDHFGAMTSLGVLYIGDDVIEEDLAYALELFRTAAQSGNLDALSNIGSMYANGYGVGVDPLAAMAFYGLAAERGNAQAAINLAYRLIETDDGWLDEIAGYGWCLSALARARADQIEEFTADCEYLSGLLDADTRSAGEARAEIILQ